ncbi:hypothetical protein [Nocardia sp. NPDC048505]|uniref:hypothetical protein n=1 Tax=unclassified Nocardia TaxID=2637762 RepID=UPI0033DEC7B6
MSAVDYPVSLALEDFVPVLLTTGGVLLLRRIVPRTAALYGAAALIGGGGFAKATAKLVAALGGPDLVWLREALFPLLSMGFGGLCVLVAGAHLGRIPRWLRYLVPSLLVACALGALAARDAIPMLVSTTVFATLTGGYLIAMARARGDAVAAGLFGTQLLGFFVLGPLAARPDQTVALQWVEQLSNTAAQAAFAVAAWRLSAAAPAADTEHEELIR